MQWESLKGRLLVAAPEMADPNFFRSVVLLLEHSGRGSLGLVLNRPASMGVERLLPAWPDRLAPPHCVFRGGPVEPQSVIGLARRGAGTAAAPGWSPVLDEVSVVDLRRDPTELGVEAGTVRVFSGYAGWGGQQLEGELAAGGWRVTVARASDAFTSTPAALWHDGWRRPPAPPAWVLYREWGEPGRN